MPLAGATLPRAHLVENHACVLTRPDRERAALIAELIAEPSLSVRGMAPGIARLPHDNDATDGDLYELNQDERHIEIPGRACHRDRPTLKVTVGGLVGAWTRSASYSLGPER